MARSHAAAAIHGRENPARRHIKTGRPILATIAGCRCDSGHETCETKTDTSDGLGEQIVGEKAVQARFRRPCEQACPNRMDASQTRTDLQTLRIVRLTANNQTELAMAVNDA
jgi:hypothetical protein